MKCPNCGMEMNEGVLYCEKCGTEIHIVPDFEPEIEDAYRQTIDKITNDLWENETAAEQQIEIPDVGKKKKKLFIIIVVVALVCIFAASLGIGIHFWHYNSPDYQLRKARKLSATGDYTRAAKYYERALELEDDVNIKVELAETYFYRNNKIEYEYLLWNIIRDENTSQEQLESAYGKLIAIYRGREDYQGINDFLLESGNDKVISLYQKYIAREPEFSILEGGYSKIQPLKLTANGEGVIYYTLDGSDPDEDAAPYTVPILLERGQYTVKAIFVNVNGIRSKIVEKHYVIEIEDIPEPVISLPAGIYQTPMLIEVLDEPENVYYTTDGNDPTADSAIYSGAIPLPLGRSVFKFMRIEAGVSSNVAVFRYELNLNTELTPQDAEKIVIDYCEENGKILDGSGVQSENGSYYSYEYQNVRNINEEGSFYVIRENLYDSRNNTVSTGTYYVVEIYSGDLYKLQNDISGYELSFIRSMPHTENDEEADEDEQ